MSFMNTIKQPKKPAQQDWHPADIVAALRKSGTSLRQLSAANGYFPTSMQRGVEGRSVACEQIIARQLKLHPMEIWPSRYTSDGERIVKRVRHHHTNVTRVDTKSNGKKRGEK